MMIDIPRLRLSAFDATLDDAAWRAGLNLWMSAFHSIPAASMDDDEGVLCKGAGLNRDVKTWRRIRTAAMRGFILCSDGRWYHETVAEFALEAWLEKLAQRLSSGAGNAKRWNIPFDPEPVKNAIGIATGLLTTLNPASKTIPKMSRHISRTSPDGINIPSEQEVETIPAGSQGEGEEKRQGEQQVDSPSEPAPILNLAEGPENPEFIEFFFAFPKQEGGKDASKIYFAARRDKGVSRETLLDGAKRYTTHLVATEQKLRYAKKAETWLVGECWNDRYDTEIKTPAPSVVVDPSWGDRAQKLSAAVEPKFFDAYFAAAEFVDSDPPCIRFKSRSAKELAERKCGRALKSTFGEIMLEVRA